MKRLTVVLLLLLTVVSPLIPCGPGWLDPMFVTEKAPENPYVNFAAGNLGILKPKYRRSVLFAAYRYLNGGGFSADHQRELVELWKDQIDHDYNRKDEISEAVKKWVDARKEVVGKEEKTPEIYTERSYGGYDFFPNCTQNAFETATETLKDRSSAHGVSDAGVTDWLRAQDAVFTNCASGKTAPQEPPVGAPQWLQKDRAYQTAAAKFYSLDYREAKDRFAEIAQDTESPWRETADYLVARTLIRQASLTKSDAAAQPLYQEAEDRLRGFTSATGKFTNSAERLLGLVKYRLHPEERVAELAQILGQGSQNENFKQDLIDYTWLLDGFESDAIRAEEERKRKEAEAKDPTVITRPNLDSTNEKDDDVPDGMMKLYVYLDEDYKSVDFVVPVDATDEKAIAAAEKVIGKPLSEEMRKRVRASRDTAYAGRFAPQSTYRGGYYSEEDLELDLIPKSLRNEDLTDWLYTFQNETPQAYLNALKRYRSSGGHAWLAAAIAKADKNSPELQRILDAAENVSATSPAYQTVVYHRARLLLDAGRSAEARKLIDDILERPDSIAISTQNEFTQLRLRLSESLDDFLRYSLKMPFAFDYSGRKGTVDEIVAEEKTYFNPEYNKEGREAYENEIDQRFADEKLWESRKMFDTATIGLFNRQLPQAVLLDAMNSPSMPDYLKPKLAIAIWTRAYLLGDVPTMKRVSPELVAYKPAWQEDLAGIAASASITARDRSTLYFILKNPVFSPFIADGIGKSDNEFGQWDSNDWWCSEYVDESESAAPTARFLTPAQRQAAQAERKRMIALGDAPELLANRVIDWSRRFPADKRVPEALFIVHEANGWTKYGCGSREELRTQIASILRSKYPNSEWTAKLNSEQQQ